MTIKHEMDKMKGNSNKTKYTNNENMFIFHSMLESHLDQIAQHTRVFLYRR